MSEHSVDLWYPRIADGRTPDEATSVRVRLMDARAADDLVIDYDFDRDGYRIRMADVAEHEEDDSPLVEVAFVPGGVEAKAPALPAPGVTWEAYLPIWPLAGTPSNFVAFWTVKDEVVPLVRRLRAQGLNWFAFLIHDYPGEAPAPHIHLRASFNDGRDVEFPGWKGVRRVDFGAPFPPVGIIGGPERSRELWGRQSAWYLDLVESIDPSVRSWDAVEIISQFLHYFANMAQIRVT